MPFYDSLVAFCQAHQPVFLLLHLVGVGVGLGGATVTDILFFNFLRDFRISHKEAEVMHLLSNIILGALGLLLLSGVGLYVSDVPKFINSPGFLAKTTILVILGFNGIALHHFISPKMIHLSFLKHPVHSVELMHRLRRISFVMGSISFTSWYGVLVIAVLKSSLLAGFSYSDLMGLYAVVLIVAIAAGQLLERKLHKRSFLHRED